MYKYPKGASKYYVMCGSLRVVISSESPEFAAMDVIDKFCDAETTVARYVSVDDSGFRELACKWKFLLHELLVNISGEYNEETETE